MSHRHSVDQLGSSESGYKEGAFLAMVIMVACSVESAINVWFCVATQAPPPPQTGRYNPLTHSWLKEPADQRYINADINYKPCRFQVSPAYLGSYNVITNQW
eukprot:319265-Prorocentrum_minimum.AAC.4